MRPLVMGVLNVTPDSFYDGGRYLGRDEAVSRGMQMAAEGADVVDVGGESSRPGAEPVPEAEELRRVLPVVRALSPHVRVSIDTRKAAVAEQAVAAGATLINDISASLEEVAGACGAGWVAMHMKGQPADMQRDPRYEDVVAEVRELLLDAVERGRATGVREIWIDPGIGFGKTPAHNLALLAHLDQLVGIGVPVMVGVSRKSFLGLLAADGGGRPAPVEDRLEPSLALAVWAMSSGAAMVRAHDVAETVQAARLVGPAAASGPAERSA
jgi:dihydropteroate synthase